MLKGGLSTTDEGVSHANAISIKPPLRPARPWAHNDSTTLYWTAFIPARAPNSTDGERAS